MCPSRSLASHAEAAKHAQPGQQQDSPPHLAFLGGSTLLSCLRHYHRPTHLDLIGCLKAVQLIQQLQHGALHLTVPATTPATAALSRTANGVHLVHENDRGGVLPAGVFEMRITSMPHVEMEERDRGDASCRGRTTPVGCQHLAQQPANCCSPPKGINRRFVYR